MQDKVMEQIIYAYSLEDVNWAELKATLKADNFDNGRTPAQYKRSAENSFLNCFAYANGKIIGTVRVLSDGVCNACIVDVWTLRAHRRQGIATRMMELVMERLEGQHACLFTDTAIAVYEKLGFARQDVGMSKVVGQWLTNESRNAAG